MLAFPGVFRGALDARARDITEEMKLAAARAIAGVVRDDELHRRYIVPSVFNVEVVAAVADAVRTSVPEEAARPTGQDHAGVIPAARDSGA